ncbi:CDP-glycerol glycerophosphotransferase family protein, partial [Shinella sp. M27]|uniref:CDP-glycerol glycerophosphotransferase family protein n=1 Tax=Shinella sp. M27 TaxID=3368614 RepID=UPI003B9F7A9F
MFKLRCLYWLTRPYFKNKRIWLTYDKLYKGGDCGEYFYKYGLTRSEGIETVYVINKDSSDRQRLEAENLKPLLHGSFKHRLYFLNSEVVFTTHGGVHNFNSFNDKDVVFIQNILRCDVCCIQHGLSVQQLAQYSSKIRNNIVRYYCASEHEVKNLSHPIYGFEDKNALKITGIPRYDGLIASNKKKIAIMPTWRNYISAPVTKRSAARSYSSQFKNSNYFKIYNKLASDKKLSRAAGDSDYELIYVLHPAMGAQISDYERVDGVEIISALDVDYEKILTESSLMITDYSGVQFDFAYMRKPVVYYHPDELP